MEADNDAGAVSTYTQAGAQYGLNLLWVLLLLLPVCYFIQEMVARLGIATGKGHAAMIYQDAEDSVCSKLAGRSASNQHRDRDDSGGGIALLVHRFRDWICTLTTRVFLLVGRDLVGLLLGRPRYKEVVPGAVYELDLAGRDELPLVRNCSTVRSCARKSGRAGARPYQFTPALTFSYGEWPRRSTN